MTAGDSLGEEGAFDSISNPRKDTAIADEDSYVFEILKSSLDKIRDSMHSSDHSLDWMTLNNYLKK